MTRFIVERHAQSEANSGYFFSGITDVSLTETGHKQAQCSAKLLYKTWKMPIDFAYSSNLRRVRRTAQYVCDLYGKELIFEGRLREINGGMWEGRPHKSLDEEYIEERIVWNNDLAHAKCPGGESMQEVYERTKSIFTELAQRHEGKNIYVATHATPINALITLCQGFDFDKIKNANSPTNASITIIEWYGNNKYKIVEQSYDKHLVAAGLA